MAVSGVLRIGLLLMGEFFAVFSTVVR